MQDIENILKTRIQNEEANSFVIIVPTDSARLKRQRELVGYHPDRAVTNLRVYTLGSFIQRLYNQVRPPRQHISQGLQNLWLHETANPQPDTPNAYRYDTFRPSQNIPVPDSTLSLIANTINRLKEYGDDTLNIGNNESQNPTEDDFVHIYNDYGTKLKDRWVDEQSKRLQLANAKNFDSLMIEAFPRVNLAVVEGFTLLSKVDIEILTRIAKIPQIEMWFRTDSVEGNENLYRNIADLVRQFDAVGANIDPDYGRETELHQHYANNLFQTDNPCVTPIAVPHLRVLEPTDRSEEVALIAHLIQEHVSEKHCKLSEICVAGYNIEQYEQRIAEIFPTYGIHYSLAKSLPLTRSEVVKAIFSRLSSRHVSLDDTYFSEVDPVSYTRLFHPDAFQNYINDLLKKGEVIQRILNPTLRKNPKVVEGEIEAYRQFKRIVKEFCSVLKSDGVESYSLNDYTEKLHHIAKHTNYQNRATTKEETVKVTRLSELRSLEFNTVFLCNFVEGSFPEDYRPDPLLPDHPYRTEEEQLYNNRFMFYGVLKSFRERLYLLTPKREGEANLIPSPFLDQLKAIATVEKMEIPYPSQGSVTGFLSEYGAHVWTTPAPSNKEFPVEISEMRPLINHVVQVEKSREKAHDYLAYEGILTAKTLSSESQKHLESLRRERYSVTELEIYAKCPFQYFVDKVLKFSIKEDETEDELSGLEKGSLLHDVLFEFYNNRRNQKRPPIGRCGEDTFKDAETHLNELLDRKATQQRNDRKEKLIGENNLFWQIDIEKLRVALRKWLEAERRYGLPVSPRYFEVSFGEKRKSKSRPRDPELSCDDPILIGDVQMTGVIDRIDIGNDTFNIIDYKTGSSTVRMPEILSGQSLQLPIYLQTAKKLLEMHGGTGLEPAAGLYHKIRLDQCKVELGIGTESENGVAYNAYNGTDWKSVNKSGQLLADETFDARLARVSGYVQQYVDSISKGTFPLITRVETFVDSEAEGDTPITPSNKTAPCSYCRYKRVCRVGSTSEVSQSDD